MPGANEPSSSPMPGKTALWHPESIPVCEPMRRWIPFHNVVVLVAEYSVKLANQCRALVEIELDFVLLTQLVDPLIS